MIPQSPIFIKLYISDKNGKYVKSLYFDNVKFAQELAQDYSKSKQFKACLIHFSKNGKSDQFWV